MQSLPETFPSFAPVEKILVAPAYGIFFKFLISIFLISLSIWGMKIYLIDKTIIVNQDVYILFLIGLGLIIYMGIILWKSKTTLTDISLSQDWFWSKTVSLQQVSYVRFVRLKGWEWLFSPRLLVKSGSGPLIAFYASSPQMWNEFERWHAYFHPSR